jgi:ACR3 family arsenite transporter
MTGLRESLEKHQVSIYFGAVVAAAAGATVVPELGLLEAAINPALAVMLFATFLQVPLGELGMALRQVRFIAALLLANFVAIPLLVALLIQFLPRDPMLQLGVLIVLLTPCIDYVVTFAHLGRADSRSLLAATPLLLVVQMVLLPFYLSVMLGEAGHGLIHAGPFIHAFVWLIAVPLVLAWVAQAWVRRNSAGASVVDALGVLPVPTTAIVLFVVVCSVVPQLPAARSSAIQATVIYVAFAVTAPLVGLAFGRLFRLPPAGCRAIAFSAATRNSLVVLPLGLAIPGASPVLPAVIVTQTLVELVSELIYVRLAPKIGKEASV